ncbi:MAG: glycerate kinase type-2 family protein [Halobacteriota archaeon]
MKLPTQDSSIIKNKHLLATTRLRKLALDIIEAGISKVLPSSIVRDSVSYQLDSLMVNNSSFEVKGRIFVIGGGKASGSMAETLESVLGPESITAGMVSCTTTDYRTEKITVMEAPHPIPDLRSIEAVNNMLRLKEQYSINEDDIVMCLISGGGSALMAYPVAGISLGDKQKVTEYLLASGAEIKEINAVRKHLSEVKGGRLGEFFYPAKVVSIIISDVVGDDVDVIASGPTAADNSTFHDALKVLEKYDLLSKVPQGVVNHLQGGVNGEVEETPKQLSNCFNFVIGNNRTALQEMSRRGEQLGLRPVIVTSEQKGETTLVARQRAKQILEDKYSDHNLIVLGGETTPVLPENHGIGGRNQHYAAVSMLELAKCKREWVVASVGTDGSDYLHEVAGAIVDRGSLTALDEQGVNIEEYISRYDSYTLLKKTSSLIITGNTGTNVSDVVLYILK